MDAEKIFNKLRLQDTMKALIVNAPKDYARLLDGLDYDTKIVAKKRGTYDFVQIFAARQSELEILCKDYASTGKYDCLFWACYPKGTGAIKSDIKRETVWKAFSLIKLRPVSQIAIDETWSALRARPADMVGS